MRLDYSDYLWIYLSSKTKLCFCASRWTLNGVRSRERYVRWQTERCVYGHNNWKLLWIPLKWNIRCHFMENKTKMHAIETWALHTHTRRAKAGSWAVHKGPKCCDGSHRIDSHRTMGNWESNKTMMDFCWIFSFRSIWWVSVGSPSLESRKNIKFPVNNKRHEIEIFIKLIKMNRLMFTFTRTRASCHRHLIFYRSRCLTQWLSISLR